MIYEADAFNPKAEWEPNDSKFEIGDRIWFCQSRKCRWVYGEANVFMKSECPQCGGPLNTWRKVQ